MCISHDYTSDKITLHICEGGVMVFFFFLLLEVMNKYRGLEQTASESDLREFLSSFKRHAPDVSTAMKKK